MKTQSKHDDLPDGVLDALEELITRYGYPVVQQSLALLAVQFRALDEASEMVHPFEPAPTEQHWHAGGTAGGPGENSAKCACGVVIDGFDTQAEVLDVLAEHIATAAGLTATPGADGPTGDGDADLRAAQRMASVAAVAPEFVQPVVDDPRGRAEVRDRRADRWAQVSAVIAAGLVGPPAEVRISEDGWSLTLTVASEAEVRAWASPAALDAGDIEVRVYSPGKSAVVREITASRSHPYAVRIACVEGLPPVPPRSSTVAAKAFAAGVTA